MTKPLIFLIFSHVVKAIAIQNVPALKLSVQYFNDILIIL